MAFGGGESVWVLFFLAELENRQESSVYSPDCPYLQEYALPLPVLLIRVQKKTMTVPVFLASADWFE